MFHKAVDGAHKNSVMSPHSIMEMLTMLAAGAEWETHRFIAQVMETDPELLTNFMQLLKQKTVNREITFSRFNHISTARDREFQEKYKHFLQHCFDTNVAIKEGVDFNDPEAIKALTTDVNNKVCEITEGGITECLDPEELEKRKPPATLVNATYFSARWGHKYKSRPGRFTLHDRSTMQASMFSATSVYTYIEYKNWTSVFIPYVDEYEMVAMLPPAGSYPVDITLDIYNALQDPGQRNWTEEIELTVPEHLFNSSFDLTKILDSKEPGSPIRPSADFSSMLKTPAWIGIMKHDAFIKTDKDGSKAGAVTVVHMKESSSPSSVTFDRPFIFLIRDKEDCAVRFIGQVYAPLKSQSSDVSDNQEGNQLYNCTLL